MSASIAAATGVSGEEDYESKVRKIHEIINAFDAHYMTRDAITGEERYPEWAVPYVKEMAEKLAQFNQEAQQQKQRHQQRQHQGDASASPNHDYHNQENLPPSASSFSMVDHTLPSFDHSINFSPTKRVRSRPSSPMRTQTKWFVDYDDDLPFLRHSRNRKTKSPDKYKLRPSSAYSPHQDFERTTSRKKKSSKKKKKKKKKKKSGKKLRTRARSLFSSSLAASYTSASSASQKEINTLRKSVAELQFNLHERLHTEQSTRIAVEGELMRVSENARHKYLSLLHKLQSTVDQQADDRVRMDEIQKEQMELLKNWKEAEENAEKYKRQSDQSKAKFKKSSLEWELLVTERDELERKNKEMKVALDNERNTVDDKKEEIENLKEQIKTMGEHKDGLMKQVLEMKQFEEKIRVELMEKVANARAETRELEKKAKETEVILDTFDRDLRSSQDSERHLKRQLGREKKIYEKEMERLERLHASLKAKQKTLADEEEKGMAAYRKHTKHSKRRSVTVMTTSAESMVPTSSAKDKVRVAVLKILLMYYRRKLKEGETKQKELLQQKHGEMQELEGKYTAHAHMLTESYERDRVRMQESIEKRETMIKEIEHKYSTVIKSQQSLEDNMYQKDIALLNQEKELLNLASSLNTKTQLVDEDMLKQKDFLTCLTKAYMGDYLNLANAPKILSALSKQGDYDIIFSDYVTKINRRNRHQKRIMVLTDKALYNFTPGSGYELKRRLRIANIKYISMSRLCSDVLVIHHESEYDYLYRVPKRSEVVHQLMELYLARTGRSLPYKYGERLFVSDKGMMHRDVEIPASQELKLSSSSLFMPDF